MRNSFALTSCKYSINIGWKGGVYAQMCGHYLHFDCYTSYKKTLEDSLARTSNNEYTCPLCRQLANCVLPVITKVLNKHPGASPSTSADSSPVLITASTLSNSPGKLWILSSLLSKEHVLTEPDTTANNALLAAYTPATAQGRTITEFILHALKSRSLATSHFTSRTLTQCKNDALAIITLTTPLEFRYINHSQPLLPTNQASPIDDDIAMFTMSVLRTQLEIDLMLRQNDEKLASLLKKRRACFIPLFDVISTHCRLMCHSFKPHVKLWQMLTSACAPESTIGDTRKDVPALLRDACASLIVLLVNLPTNIERQIFESVVQAVFNLVFAQNVLALSREFDAEERATWAAYESGQDGWCGFRDYVGRLIKSFDGSNVLESEVANFQKRDITYMVS